MDVREIRSDESDAVRSIADASLTASYGDFLAADTIEAMVEEWYGRDRLEQRIEDDGDVFLVADDDGEVVGFVDGSILHGDHVVGEIHWLHVVPEARGNGIGVQLLGHVQDTFETAGAAIVRGEVLADNREGRAFYEDHGFTERGARTVTVAVDEYDEIVYEKPVDDRRPTEVIEQITGPEGSSLYVNFSSPTRGDSAPFYPTFADEELAERFGWVCGACDSVETAMDSMGRIVCNECDNSRKATRWDAGYL